MAKKMKYTPGLPLAGVRVIDLTTVLFGPYASQLLADYGADVIKIESPGGDSTRRTGPAAEPGMAAGFIGANRNKRSIVLDLKTPGGQAALLALIEGADVFMHNMRPGKLAGLGLEPDSLLGENPRLVYAGLHGFGESGPYAGRPAYDDIIQGLCGMAGLNEMRDGEASFFPGVLADKTCGVFAAMAISMALFRRSHTGRGGFVEIPMFEAMSSFMLLEHLSGHYFEPPVASLGYARLLTRWRKPHRTSNGYICVVPYTDAHWHAFFSRCGMPELLNDARFADIDARTRNIDELYRLLGCTISQHATEHWLEEFGKMDIPVAPVNALSDMEEDVHLRAAGFFRTVVDGSRHPLKMMDAPVRFDRVQVPMRMPPRLGEHTTEVLRQAAIPVDHEGRPVLDAHKK